MNDLKIRLAIAYAQTMLKHGLELNAIPPYISTDPSISSGVKYFYDEFTHALDELENYPEPEVLITKTR